MLSMVRLLGARHPLAQTEPFPTLQLLPNRLLPSEAIPTINRKIAFQTLLTYPPVWLLRLRQNPQIHSPRQDHRIERSLFHRMVRRQHQVNNRLVKLNRGLRRPDITAQSHKDLYLSIDCKQK